MCCVTACWQSRHSLPEFTRKGTQSNSRTTPHEACWSGAATLPHSEEVHMKNRVFVVLLLATVLALPAFAQQDNSSTQSQPATTQSQPATTQAPDTTQSQPAAATQAPDTTQSQPATTQSQPATTQQGTQPSTTSSQGTQQTATQPSEQNASGTTQSATGKPLQP